ncbi:hypothetical protein [uncultured Paludibaculum sp.]|uniref:hypothetical protein n=1 Tax=uncultured Paludibaculum sp. TaxID=1765020 RepID=UPI002AAB7100|nr:hypothetical protein [uncultured Paludibaculum sp.]
MTGAELASMGNGTRASHVSALLKQVALSLDRQPEALANSTLDAIRSDALAAMAVLEGRRELLDREADALGHFLMLLRHAPSDASTVRAALGVAE